MATNYPDGVNGSHPYFNAQDAECPECCADIDHIEWLYCPWCGARLQPDEWDGDEYIGCSPYDTMRNYRHRRRP